MMNNEQEKMSKNLSNTFFKGDMVTTNRWTQPPASSGL